MPKKLPIVANIVGFDRFFCEALGKAFPYMRIVRILEKVIFGIRANTNWCEYQIAGLLEASEGISEYKTCPNALNVRFNIDRKTVHMKRSVQQ